MRLSREMLRKIIMEQCGDVVELPTEKPVALEPVEPVVETSVDPTAKLMVEMEVATRALEQVVESVQNAAHLCPDCPAAASQTPIMEAVVAQAEALQEMLDAQHEVISESAVPDIGNVSLVEI